MLYNREPQRYLDIYSVSHSLLTEKVQQSIQYYCGSFQTCKGRQDKIINPKVLMTQLQQLSSYGQSYFIYFIKYPINAQISLVVSNIFLELVCLKQNAKESYTSYLVTASLRSHLFYHFLSYFSFHLNYYYPQLFTWELLKPIQTS